MVDATSHTPRAMWSAAAVEWSGDMVLFGGYTLLPNGPPNQPLHPHTTMAAAYNVSHDLWLYRTNGNGWSLITPSGTWPSARGGLQAVRTNMTLPGTSTPSPVMLIFGGDLGNSTSNELWALDLSTWTWVLVDDGQTQPAPLPRSTGSVNLLAPDLLAVYGGIGTCEDAAAAGGGGGGGLCQQGRAAFGDLWLYNLTARRWHPTSAAGPTPGPRWAQFSASATTADLSRLVLTGGVMAFYSSAVHSFLFAPAQLYVLDLANCSFMANGSVEVAWWLPPAINNTAEATASAEQFASSTPVPYTATTTLRIGGMNVMNEMIVSVFALDVATLEWSELPPLIPDLGTYAASMGPAAAYSPLLRMVLVFGGVEFLDAKATLWLWDTLRNVWLVNGLSLSFPEPRAWMGSIVLDNQLICSGGYNGFEVLGETWAFSFALSRWSKIIATNNQLLGRRFGHVCVLVEAVLGPQTALIYGGIFNEPGPIDLLTFDVSTNTYAAAPLVPGSPRPLLRGQPAATVYNSCLYIYGGLIYTYTGHPVQIEEQVLGDFWRLCYNSTMAAWQWQALPNTTAVTPGRRTESTGFLLGNKLCV